MIEIIVWIAFGALIGWVASLIMGTDERQGGLANIIIGIIGAVIGGFIARTLGAEGVTGFNVVSFLVSLGGAMLLIAIYKMFTRKNI
jgi:uncharacterized membrane protein YeaQ/YmgE (transglycosylase-associated protein family)